MRAMIPLLLLSACAQEASRPPPLVTLTPEFHPGDHIICEERTVEIGLPGVHKINIIFFSKRTFDCTLQRGPDVYAFTPLQPEGNASQ